jgi:hypothetical protein
MASTQCLAKKKEVEELDRKNKKKIKQIMKISIRCPPTMFTYQTMRVEWE